VIFPSKILSFTLQRKLRVILPNLFISVGRPQEYFLPLELRKILLVVHKANDVVIHAMVRREHHAGSKLKEIEFKMGNASVAQEFCSMLMSEIYGCNLFSSCS
jgi:hypothetical protein